MTINNAVNNATQFRPVVLSGDSDLAVTGSNSAFVFEDSGLTLSDDLGLSYFSNGYTFSLKNISSGTCQFIQTVEILSTALRH